MSGVIPPNNLGPASQSWAREMENRVVGLEGLVDQSSGREANTNAGLNASITTLAGQVSLLSSLITVGADSNEWDTINTPVSPGVETISPFSPGIDPEISVTCATGRMLVSVSCVGDLVTYGGSAGVYGYAYFFMYPEVVGGGLTTKHGIRAVGSIQGVNSFYTTINGTFTQLVQVPPGTYTVRGRRGVLAGGSSTFLNASTTYRSVTAQVIQ